MMKKFFNFILLFILTFFFTGLLNVSATSHDMYTAPGSIYADLHTCDTSWTTVPLTVDIPTSIDYGDTNAIVNLTYTGTTDSVRISEIELNGVYYNITDLDTSNRTETVYLPTNLHTTESEFSILIGHVKYSGCSTSISIGTYNITPLDVEINNLPEPVIFLNGPATIYIEAGGTYTEFGAVLTDNYDIDTLATASGTVNVDKLGTYTITYSGTNSNGFVADSITRTVIVRDTTAPVIELNGSKILYIEAGVDYTELGAILTDNYDDDTQATASGTVNVDKLGTYTITYSGTDSNGIDAISITRTIIVEDTTAPVIVLNGSETIYVKTGETYTELGAILTDNYDADTAAIASGSVDVDTIGTYLITYTGNDTNNLTAEPVTRTVIVSNDIPVIQITPESDTFMILGFAWYWYALFGGVAYVLFGTKEGRKAIGLKQ